MGRGPRALSSDCTPWDDVDFWLPDAAARARVTVYYQTATRHYIEALRDGNVTDDWGQILYDLWLQTDKAAPVPIVSAELVLEPFLRGDFDLDGDVDGDDFAALEDCYTGDYGGPYATGCAIGDFDGDGDVDCLDGALFAAAWTEPGESPVLAACRAIVEIPVLSPWGVAVLSAALALAGLSLQARRRKTAACP